MQNSLYNVCYPIQQTPELNPWVQDFLSYLFYSILSIIFGDVALKYMLPVRLFYLLDSEVAIFRWYLLCQAIVWTSPGYSPVASKLIDQHANRPIQQRV